jgi:hypothetical protein
MIFDHAWLILFAAILVLSLVVWFLWRWVNPGR